MYCPLFSTHKISERGFGEWFPSKQVLLVVRFSRFPERGADGAADMLLRQTVADLNKLINVRRGQLLHTHKRFFGVLKNNDRVESKSSEVFGVFR